ncbi:MAG: RibD family protein [Desulfobacterales bacterium]|nr:MAG: RibD family protein [Desulfobacterales bacterium]
MPVDNRRKIQKNSCAPALAAGLNPAPQLPHVPIQSVEGLRAHLSRVARRPTKPGRPFITISYAQSVDGSIASRNRSQLHLSSPQALALTHQIRASCDSILIGIGTVLADNPRLTVRLVAGANPQPIILDTRLRIPLNANLLCRRHASPWIINGPDNARRQRAALKKAGATPLSCATAADGKIDLDRLMALLTERQINSIMVEGGAQVITSFINAQLVDQFIITITPKLVGGLPVLDPNRLTTASHLNLGDVQYQQLAGDLIMWARPLWDSQ